MESQLSDLTREVQRVTHIVAEQSLQIKQLREVACRMLEHQLRTLDQLPQVAAVRGDESSENGAASTAAGHAEHSGTTDNGALQRSSSNNSRNKKKRRRPETHS